MKTTLTTCLNRSMLTAAAAALALGLSAGASARTVDNGLSLNGISMNGISMNGISLNGLSLNGISMNGLSFNGRDTGTAPIHVESMVLPDGTSIQLR